MPLDKFVLILVIVLGVAAATIALGWLIFVALAVPGPGWLVFVPAALIAYVAYRVLIDRIGNKDDDHYDHIQK